MGKDVAKRENATGLAAMAKGLKRTRANMPSFGGKPYLKFGKDGEWTCGKGSDAMNDEVAMLNMLQLQSGFVCWTDYPAKEKRKNEKVGEEMQRVVVGEIDPSTLPDTGWTWKPQMSIEGRFVTGDQQEFVYNTNSQGGLEALDGVLEDVMERVEEENPFYFPLVKLLDDWYDHSQWGKTYKPILEIVGWADETGEPEDSGEPKKLEKPKRGEKEPEPEPEEDEEEDEAPDADEGQEEEADEPPVRRRRRR